MQRFALFWGLSWFAIVKGWHVTEFFMLTLFTVSAVKWWRNAITDWSIVGSMLPCIAFAASDEWHQSFIPDRFGTLQDVLIDSLGICAAGSFLLLRLN
jgi:VanZ family protein